MHEDLSIIFSRDLVLTTRTYIISIITLIAVSLTAGCSNEPLEPNVPPPPMPEYEVSLPEDPQPIEFNMLNLSAKPKDKILPPGVTQVDFKYTDVDGQLYNVLMPKPYVNDQYELVEWSQVFRLYKMPKQDKKRVVAKKVEYLYDFPFISPKQQDNVMNMEDMRTNTQADPYSPAPAGPTGNLPGLPGLPAPGGYQQ